MWATSSDCQAAQINYVTWRAERMVEELNDDNGKNSEDDKKGRAIAEEPNTSKSEGQTEE